MDRIPSNHLMLWMILAGSWFVFAIWHARENRELLRKMGIAGFDGIFVAQMVKFAWSRSAQQLMMMFLLTASIITFDWQYLQLRPSPLFSIVVRPDPSTTQTQPAEYSVVLPQQSPNWLQTPAAEIIASSEAMYASLAPAAGQAPNNVTPTARADAEAINKAGLVQQVYDTPRVENTFQAQLDNIKQSYEELFISYFFLNKCGHARDEQYYIINSALSQEIASMRADERLQNDIISAAQGSYNEIYSKVSCASQDLETMSGQFESYTDSLARTFSALNR